MSDLTNTQPSETKSKTNQRFVENEWNRFQKICSASDPALFLLRVHLLTEFYIDRLLATLLPRADRVLENGNLSYHQKLYLLSAFDVLDDKYIQSLKNLNKVRNRFSHELETSISISDLDLIGRPLGIQYTAMRSKHVEHIEMLSRDLAQDLVAQLAAHLHVKELAENSKE